MSGLGSIKGQRAAAIPPMHPHQATEGKRMQDPRLPLGSSGLRDDDRWDCTCTRGRTLLSGLSKLGGGAQGHRGVHVGRGPLVAATVCAGRASTPAGRTRGSTARQR